jgi:hypothetical protein
MTNRLKVSSSVSAYALEIGSRTRWVAGKTFSGGPVPGIGDLGFGIMPEEFRDAVRDAVYAVYSYETPIVAEVAGRWLVPDVIYSSTTGQHRSAITGALDVLGIPWEKLPGMDGKTVRISA